MTDVHCDNKSCLNNRKGWCAANGIHVNKQDRCMSYAAPATMIRHACAKVRREQGKCKGTDAKVYK